MTKRSPWSNPRWRRYSRWKRKIHPFCTNCRASDDLEVHHLVYLSILGKRLPLWMAFPWNLMVLCSKCHSKISKIHHAGKANHRNATKMVMGWKYTRWNWLVRITWFAPAIVLAAIVIMGMI